MPNEGVLTSHVDAMRRAKTGRVTAVHHIALGWISPRAYYALQKAHEAEKAALEVARGGYLLNAAIYGFMPEVGVAGISIPIPAGPALLGAAIVHLTAAIQAKDPKEILHAAFKVAGPFGAVMQAVESLQGALVLGEAILGQDCSGLKATFDDYARSVAGNDPPGAEFWKSRANQVWDLASSKGCEWTSQVTEGGGRPY